MRRSLARLAKRGRRRRPKPKQEPEPEIDLTPTEAAVFGAIRDATRLPQTRATVRIAGGWVRDKLLGLECDDIDAAVEGLSGVRLAQGVSRFLRARAPDGGEQDGGAGKMYVVKRNPDQSKHLETACLPILGVDVDFAELRSETYAPDSRIPAAVAGATAAEDAARRDFTLNALFFNIHTGRVEDLTGRGRADLEAGLLRTPLEPRATLLDDPLRALRAVRFACRFGFAVDEALLEAARSGEVRHALAAKVSPERVFKELGKALASPAYARCVALLGEMRLAEPVFGEGVWASEAEWRQGAARVAQLQRMGLPPDPALVLAALLSPAVPEPPPPDAFAPAGALSWAPGAMPADLAALAAADRARGRWAARVRRWAQDTLYDALHCDKRLSSAVGRHVSAALVFSPAVSTREWLLAALPDWRAAATLAHTCAADCEAMPAAGAGAKGFSVGGSAAPRPDLAPLEPVAEALERPPLLRGDELQALAGVRGRETSRAVEALRLWASSQDSPDSPSREEAEAWVRAWASAG